MLINSVTYLLTVTLYHCIAGMLFENCESDPRVGNVLTSPELTLESDQELTFTVMYPLTGNDRSLTLYQTSATGHPTTMLGSYSPPTDSSSSGNSSNGTSSAALRDATHTVCVPAGTYQLAFIATKGDNITDSNAAVTEVSLTGVSCTYDPLSGRFDRSINQSIINS